MFQLQRSVIDNFFYLNSWHEQNDANQNARLALRILKTWDPFLSNLQTLNTSNTGTYASKNSIWELYFGRQSQIQPVAEQILRQSKVLYLSNLKNLPIAELIFKITAILRLWQINQIQLSDEEYIELTKMFLEKSKILPKSWDFWIVLFEDTEEFTSGMKLQSIQIWPQVISSFLQSWTSFGKQYFGQPPQTLDEAIKSPKLDPTTEFSPIAKSVISNHAKHGNICITGKFGLAREEIEELLTANGWLVTKSVLKNTKYLLAGFNPGTKIKEANNKHIQIIDWAGLLELISTKNFVSNNST